MILVAVFVRTRLLGQPTNSKHGFFACITFQSPFPMQLSVAIKLIEIVHLIHSSFYRVFTVSFFDSDYSRLT